MTMADMTSDLAPVYTKHQEGDLARGIGRATVQEIVGFYRSRVEQFSNMRMNCTDCRYLHGSYCRHWQDKVPHEFRAQGCDDWQWDGVPF